MAQTTTEHLSTHPNPIPNPHHRKVELQSHADLTFLQQNIAKVARERLDLHFPPQNSTRQAKPAEVITLGGAPAQPAETTNHDQKDVEEDEDELRRHVRLLVDSFIQQTFQSASHSITVNGIDASTLPPTQIPTCSNPDLSAAESAFAKEQDPSQEIEGIHYTYSSFDSRLAKRVAALYGELETLTTQVSKLRREAPTQAANSYATALQDALAKDEQGWEEELRRVQTEKHTGLELEPMRDGWNEDVRDMYGRGVDTLSALSGVKPKSDTTTPSVPSLTESVGRAQRARTVAMEFE